MTGQTPDNTGQGGTLRRLGPTGFLAAAALVLPPLGSLVLFTTMGTTGPWLRGHENLGILLYIVGFSLLAGFAFLPTYAQSALGGFAFGLTLGIPAALLGFAGGAIIGYEIAHRASGDRVEKLIEEKPKWRAVRDALMGPPEGVAHQQRRGFWKTLGMVTLLRLPPNSPFALTNLVMASVKVPRAPFVVGTVLGMLPRSSLAVVIGASVDQLTKDSLKQAAPDWVWYAGIGVTVAIVVMIGLIANRAIERVTARQAPKPEAGAVKPE